jgi:hypothetical protein
MMRILVFLLAGAALHAQAIATVNGKPVTQAELDTFKSTLPPQMTAIAGSTPSLLRYYGFVNRMAELAEKAGLAEKSPYKEQLALQRTLTLSQAMGTEYGRDVPVTAEDEQKFYDQHKDLFVAADVVAVRSPDKAKATTFTQIRRYDDTFSSAMRDAVFAVKPGETTIPIVQPDGIYVFRIVRVTPQPFSEVRGYTSKAVSDERYQSWIASVTKSVTVAEPRP